MRQNPRIKQLDLRTIGITMKNLNEAIVGRLPIPNARIETPNVFIDQLKCVFLSAGRSREAVIWSIDRLHEFRSALITAAVTGQIDVAT